MTSKLFERTGGNDWGRPSEAKETHPQCVHMLKTGCDFTIFSLDSHFGLSPNVYRFDISCVVEHTNMNLVCDCFCQVYQFHKIPLKPFI